MEKNRIHTEKAPAAIGPYSQAIDLGEMIFTSGQIPVAPDGSISEDISEQTRQALLNLKPLTPVLAPPSCAPPHGIVVPLSVSLPLPGLWFPTSGKRYSC